MRARLILWPEPSIAPLSDGAIETFQVTHPFHPLHGQTFRLVTYRHNWGADRVYYQDARGQLRSLPAAWTNFIAEDPVVKQGAGRAAFRLADLLELARLLEALRAPGGVK